MSYLSRANPTCGFCKRNNEDQSVYTSHQLKDKEGNVTCPQLFKYRCELCGCTGKEAHTRSYCPLVSSMSRQPSGDPLVRAGSSNSSSSSSISITRGGMFRNMGKVTNSRYNSAGRLRNKSNRQQANQSQVYNSGWNFQSFNNFASYDCQLSNGQNQQQDQHNFDHNSV